jgi:hypothetical protein
MPRVFGASTLPKHQRKEFSPLRALLFRAAHPSASGPLALDSIMQVLAAEIGLRTLKGRRVGHWELFSVLNRQLMNRGI